MEQRKARKQQRQHTTNQLRASTTQQLAHDIVEWKDFESDTASVEEQYAERH